MSTEKNEDPCIILADAFNRKALGHLAVDFQRRYSRPDLQDVFSAGKAFSEVCRIHHIPNVWLMMTLTPDGKPMVGTDREFDRVQPTSEESVFEKDGWSGFTNPKLDPCLKKSGIDTLMISGVMYDECIFGNIYDAMSLGYTVLPLTDAINLKNRKDPAQARADALAFYYRFENGRRLFPVTTSDACRVLEKARGPCL
jgi:nicotinamidase-related amidase